MGILVTEDGPFGKGRARFLENVLFSADPKNDYERAFESWMRENLVQFVPVDQSKRGEFARNKVKSFDFLVYPANGGPYVVEVKGRRFKGKSLAGQTGMDCWVPMEDVRSLMQWEDAFEGEFEGMFVFAFWLENVAVDPAGREIHVYDHRGYVYYTVSLSEYSRAMKQRSPKWQTVTLSADDFRALAHPVEETFLSRQVISDPQQGRLFEEI